MLAFYATSLATPSISTVRTGSLGDINISKVTILAMYVVHQVLMFLLNLQTWISYYKSIFNHPAYIILRCHQIFFTQLFRHFYLKLLVSVDQPLNRWLIQLRSGLNIYFLSQTVSNKNKSYQGRLVIYFSVDDWDSVLAFVKRTSFIWFLV